MQDLCSWYVYIKDVILFVSFLFFLYYIAKNI